VSGTACRGPTTAANRAITRASTASAFASRPSARAKSRTCRGFTTATGRPAASRSAAARRSYPPVDSSATRRTSKAARRSSSSRTPAASFGTRSATPAPAAAAAAAAGPAAGPAANSTNASSVALDTSIPTRASGRRASGAGAGAGAGGWSVMEGTLPCECEIAPRGAARLRRLSGLGSTRPARVRLSLGVPSLTGAREGTTSGRPPVPAPLATLAGPEPASVIAPPARSDGKIQGRRQEGGEPDPPAGREEETGSPAGCRLPPPGIRKCELTPRRVGLA
jgi:hypothetical protein